MQTTPFTSPGFDYSADISKIERRKALSQALQQSSMQPMDVPQAGAGQFQASVSPWQGAAKIAQAYGARRQEQKADQGMRELSAKTNKDLADVLRRGQMASAGQAATPLSEDASGNVTPAQAAVAGDPSKAASVYMQHPMTMQMGQQLMQQEMQNQGRQRMLADLVKAPSGNGATPGGPWSGEYAAGSTNPLSSVDPKVLSMILSGDAEMSKLGTHLMGSRETAGRVFYDQNNQAYTLDKSGRRIDIAGTKQGISPAEQMRIPIEQSRHYWETGQRPGPLGTPGQQTGQGGVPNLAQQAGARVPPQAPMPQMAPQPPQPQPSQPMPQQRPPAAAPAQTMPSNLPPKMAAEVEAARQKQVQEMGEKRQFNMGGIGAALDEAERILTGGAKDGLNGAKVTSPKPTSSLVGSAVDTAAGWVGQAPRGAAEADKIRALGGAIVAKMPRMEGPQSDRDVLMYREMAGQIGDASLPISRRVAALQTVRELWQKYEGGAQGTPSAPAAASRPRAVNPKTGEAVEWDGKKWVKAR